MRYSTSHKEETRQRLLQSSREIAKRGGFDSTGVDALMASVGLTGGAFYGHFPSKQALFQALIEEEMAHSTELLAGEAGQDEDHVEKCLRQYLSHAHAQHPESGCALPALGAEIARAGSEVRSVVEQALKRTQKSWAGRTGDEDLAWALLAQCVGALVLARAVEGERTRKQILGSSRHFLAQALAAGKTARED
ncbi:MAG: TetR/AcrR family transcriptional regulator [Curvibacter sp.]|nr:TetR/AcrR family transcriptional regulator [Curvibacter sp.]